MTAGRHITRRPAPARPVRTLVPTDPAIIRVSLPASTAADRSYDVAVGRGLLGSLGKMLRDAGCRRTLVVSDAAVSGTHAKRAAAAVEAVGIDVDAVEIPRGETSKSVPQLERLWEEMARLAIDRHTHVIGVGGGVVGDLAGFAAATFNRGLPVWHVPTTLVAQVDSAIGGKTGINLAGGKNLAGSFWQPRGVLCDVETLATLPDREFRSGLAEVVKYGMILDAPFFAWLEANATAVAAREPASLEHVVHRSATLKAGVVTQDEREVTGLRAILNYGHTFAHAYETAAGYGALLHGEAVAIGMTDAAELAVARGRIDRETADRQRNLLVSFGLPVDVPPSARQPIDRLIDIMGRDKKSVAGRLRFILPSRIGHVDLVDDVPTSDVRDVLAR
jgi:3-dehydroquinate synthase